MKKRLETVKTYYDNGVICMEISCILNVNHYKIWHGIFKHYYPNGQFLELCIFNKGIRNGCKIKF